MREKIKQNFLLLVFLFIVLGLFFPISSAEAIVIAIPVAVYKIAIGIAGMSWVGVQLIAAVFEQDILDATITNLVLAFVVAGLQLLLLFPAALLTLSILLLGLVINPNFITLSYTKLDNPIIEIGWTLTRDLTNMGFVIILVIIGLATALRIGEYQWQKTLPLLIGVALLINFTPVILGLIVDASNIVMYFFIGDMIDLSFVGSMWLNNAQDVLESFGRAKFFAEVQYAPLVQTIALIIFAFLTAAIFFAFALLFFMRYIAIWMLVILSPLAFAAYILPNTRGFFNMWWKQFIQWCIIGIACAFFLYLTAHLLKIGDEGGLVSGRIAPPPGQEDVTGGIVNTLIPFGVAIAFSYIGLFIALSTSAMGASGVIGLAQKGVKATEAWVKRGVARRVVAPAAGAIAGGVAAAARKTEKWGEKTKWAKPLAWVTRGIEMATVSPLIEYAAKQRRIKKPENWDRMSIPEKVMYTQGLAMAQDQLVLASEMANEGTYQKADPGFRKMVRAIRDKFNKDLRYKKEVGSLQDAEPDEITKEIKIRYEATTEGQEEMREKINAEEKRIRDTYSDKEIEIQTAEKLKIDRSKVTIEDKQRFIENTAAGIVHMTEMKTADLSNIRKGSLTSFTGKVAFQRMTDQQIQKIYNTFGRDVMDELVNGEGGINKIFEGKSKEEATKLVEKLYKENPRLFRFATQTPAGKAMNFEFTKYMQNVAGLYTENLKDFTERMDIFSKLEKFGLNTFVAAKNKLQRSIKEEKIVHERLRLELSQAQVAGAPTASLQQQITTKEGKIQRYQARLQQIQTQIDRNVKRLIRDPQKAQELEEIRKIENKKGVQIIS